jgi:dolichol-phosphate mannosyltransferase
MLNIVIPVRNERESVGPLFEKFVSAMADYREPYRIVVVDGDSSDGTPEVIRGFADRLPVEVVELGRNIGLGGALEEGLLRALEDGDTIITMDGDDSHDPHAIPAMLQKLDEGYDLVVASRFEPGGEEIGVAGYRKVLSHGASGLLRFLFPVGTVKDYSSGFRAYRASALHDAKQRYGRLVSESGFSCMMELLLKLRTLGVSASEVPLVLRYDLKQSDSKMDIGHTIGRYIVVIGKNLRFARGLNRPVRQAA